MPRVEQSIPERAARTTSLPGPVRRSLEVCREITRTRAGSFYLALCLTPEPRRSAMYALYAWSRLADDTADETPGEAAILRGLEQLSRDTKAAFNNVPAGDDSTLWPGVCWAFRDFGIKPQWCEDLIEGMRREAAGVALTSMAQFDDYCYRVAGTVGLMCMSVWGVRPGVRPDAWIEPAKARGRALQTITVRRAACMCPPRSSASAAWSPTACANGATMSAAAPWWLNSWPTRERTSTPPPSSPRWSTPPASASSTA